MNEHSSIDEFLWPNRYMLNFLGFWPMSLHASTASRIFTYLRAIFSIFIMSSLFIPQILMIVNYWGNISIVAEVGCVMIQVVRCVFKLLYMVLYQRKFFNIYRTCKELWEVSNDKKERESFEQLPKLAKKFTIAFFFIGVSNLFTFMSGTVIIWVTNHLQSNGTSHTRNLLFDAWYGIDTQQTPIFEMIFCSQFGALLYATPIVVGFDATMMTLILHICGQFRLVCTRFRTIGVKMRESAYSKLDYSNGEIRRQKEIGQCIEHHERAIRVAKEVDALLSPVIFFQLITSGINICTCGYALLRSNEKSNRSDTIKLVTYIVTIFVQLVIWCWPGELLIQESTYVGDIVYYEVPWYLLKPGQQRDLGFLIFRTQRQCQVTGFGFQVISLRKLTEVFNAAASYFALLRRVSE